jgi:L-fuconolactonase
LRIDSHVVFSQRHPPEHLKAILERNRFDGAILLVEGKALPPVTAPILGLVIHAGGLDAATLDRYQQHSAFRGIQCSLQGGIPEGLDELARRAIPLDVEMRSGDFPTLLRLAERLPGLRLVIDHMARPQYQQGITDEWAHGMEAAALLPQVFCKISGLLTEVEGLPWCAEPIRPFVQHVLSVFPPSRLMFGSEWPARLPDIAWKESLAAFTQSIGARTMAVREQLMGDTARDFYGI